MTNLEPMRILHIMSGFGGGISSFIMNKAREMPQYNVIFDVVTYEECNDEFKSAIEATGGSIYQMVNPRRENWKAFKNSLELPLKLNQYDVIHCHIAGYRTLAYYYVCRKHSKALFYIHAHTVQDVKGKYLKKIRRWGKYRLNQRLTYRPIGCGMKAIESLFGTTQGAKVLPNSISEQDYLYSDSEYQELRDRFRNDYNIKDQTLVIAHIGRLTQVKNHKKTISIAKELDKKNIDYKLLIIGSGLLAEELNQMITSEDLQDKVLLVGRLSPITEVFPSIDAMILPSFTEGLPTTAVEAQAAGIPILLSDTITKEVDLGLNLVAYESIEEDSKLWVDNLLKLLEYPVPNFEQRFSVLQEQGYTNQAAGYLYFDYFNNQVEHAKEALK